jgi:EmrB/QacA subfamily drug resistance transporter
MNKDRLRTSALIIATLTSFMTPFMGSAINIALPSIQKQFQIDAVLLSWVATSYLLAAAISLVPFGRAADIYGRKKIFAYGIAVFTISSFLSGISISALMLILFRIVQGIGSGMIFATGIAILTSVFPLGERGRVLGINVAAVYTGLSMGPLLGGFLTQHFTWRSIFLVNVPFGLIVTFLVLWKLKGEWAEAEGEKFDFIGAVIYCAAIIGVMYGISLLPERRGVGIILFGLLAFLAFIKWELRVQSPVFKLTLFRTNRVFAFSSLAALIHYSATFAVTFLLSLYLQYLKGLSPQIAGLILVSQPIVMAICSPFAGRLSDKIEPRTVASIGMDKDTSLLFIVANLAVLGLGYALFSSPNTNAIMSSVEKRFYGIASGSVGTMRLLGMMISMGIAALLFAIFIGRVQITTAYYLDFMRSARVAFIIFWTLCIGGVFASLVRGKLRPGIAESA